MRNEMVCKFYLWISVFVLQFNKHLFTFIPVAHAFLHSYIQQYLLRTSYIPDTMRGVRDLMAGKKRHISRI